MEENVNSTDLNQATIMIGAMLLYNAYQRPGAVINCIMSEFAAARTFSLEDKNVVVITVKQHKTGISGSAKRTIDSKDYSRLEDYVVIIQPLIDPDGELWFAVGLV